MTVDELIDRLNRLKRAERIDGDTDVAVRNPDVSEGAMDAGSDGYHVVDEVLVSDPPRVILLGEEF